MSTEILDAIDAEVDTLGAELAQLSEKLDAGRKRVEALSMTRELVEGLGNGRLEELHEGLKGMSLLPLRVKPEAVKPPPEKKPARSKPKGGRKKVAAAATAAPSGWEAKREAIDATVLRSLQSLDGPTAFSAVRRLIPGEVSTNALKSSLRRLIDAGQLQSTGQRAGTRYSLPGRAARKAPASAPTPKPDRAARSEEEEKANRQALACVREHGRASEEQVAAALGVTSAEAARRLQGLARTGPLKKTNGLWSLEAAMADDDGAKTGPERRVLAAIREAGGSLDETTLAGAAEMPSANVRTYAGGLVNRQVLTRKIIEGITFYELPKKGDA